MNRKNSPKKKNKKQSLEIYVNLNEKLKKKTIFVFKMV